MINPFPHEDHDLESAIASAYSDLNNFKADTDEYAKAVDQLSKLYKIRNTSLQSFQEAQQFELNFSIEQEKLGLEEAEASKPFYLRLSPDAALTVTGNLLIALIVVKYEQTGVVRTVVKDFIKKF